jgi:iron complex transport system substrate-binding protein
MTAALLPLPALAEPINDTDLSGDQITVAQPVHRIVCFSVTCLHDLALLGSPPLAAWPDYYRHVVSHPDLFGAAATSITILPGMDAPDLEALTALDPDLVVAWAGALPEEFEAAVAPVYVADDPLLLPDLAALGHSLLSIGALTGRTAEAQGAVQRVTERAATYQRLRDGAVPPRLLVVRLEAPDTGSIWALPCGPLTAALAACVNETGDWLNVTVEGLLALNPDLLVVEDWGQNEGTFPPDSWAGVPLWSEVPAVAQGRVHYLPVHHVGPYSVLSYGLMLDTLMPLLYPETFPAPLTDAEVAAALAE